jgi:hypothetical protein
MSPAQKPYVICTTSPSTERDSNEGGEWTFISPLSLPFPNWETERAYHCLIQIQSRKSPHLHIHASAISPQGNLIALLDSNGRICLIPLVSCDRGGMITDTECEPIEVYVDRKWLFNWPKKAKLGRNEDQMAAIRFDPSGTRLYAVNWNGTVVVVNFPQATPAESL